MKYLFRCYWCGLKCWKRAKQIDSAGESNNGSIYTKNLLMSDDDDDSMFGWGRGSGSIAMSRKMMGEDEEVEWL
jgi:hypothetical protein